MIGMVCAAKIKMPTGISEIRTCAISSLMNMETENPLAAAGQTPKLCNDENTAPHRVKLNCAAQCGNFCTAPYLSGCDGSSGRNQHYIITSLKIMCMQGNWFQRKKHPEETPGALHQ